MLNVVRARRTLAIRFSLLSPLGLAFLAMLVQPALAEDGVAQARSLSRAFRKAAGEVTPSVVTVIAKIKPQIGDIQLDFSALVKDPQFRELFPDTADDEQLRKRLVASEYTTHIGSGLIIHANGTILTNAHVVENADEVTIRFAGGTELVSVGIKSDPASDLAIVQVRPEKPLPAAQFGDSDSLEIGDWVIAVGNPFHLEATVSAGIISGKGRTIGQVQRAKLLQTDADIYPGSSGGPLADLDGKVIGINTAITTTGDSFKGVGFAIPINQAKWIADELVAHGRVRRGYLGVRINDVGPEHVQRLGLRSHAGVVVLDAVAGSPAADAGLRSNDVIIDVAGMPVENSTSLQTAVENKPLGSKQPVTIIRGGERQVVQVVVRGLPAEAAAESVEK